MNVKELIETLTRNYPDDATVVVVCGNIEAEDITVEKDEAEGLIYCVIEIDG